MASKYTKSAGDVLRKVPKLGSGSVTAVIRRDVIDVLRKGGTLHLRNIASQVKWQPSRVRIALEAMETEGIVRQTLSGKWALAAQEIDELDYKVKLLKALAKKSGNAYVIAEVSEIVGDLERLGGAP